MPKQYIGDGVYVDFDGYGLVLTTENGVAVTNTVVLEPEVYNGLIKYIARIEKIKQFHTELRGRGRAVQATEE